MKRTLIVILLAVAALVLLAGAVMKSRSIPLEAHIAYYQLTADLERLGDDFETLITYLETSWSSAQPPGEAAVALQQRVIGNLDGIEQAIDQIPAGMLERQRIDSVYARLKRSMATMESHAADLLRTQATYAESMRFLRERGSEIVRELRARGRSGMATDISQLTEEAIALGQPDSTASPRNIPLLLTTLHRDLRLSSNLPRGTESLVANVETLLDSKNDTESRLYQLSVLPVADDARTLGQAAGSGYENAVASADRARVFLAIYAVVLLLVVGVIGYRLRSSYRQLNEANEELGELNESLERRVNERTEKLSNALTDLKESQVQLVQAEKMSSLGQLVAGISHEINTPLLYLANNAELTQERIALLGDFVQQSAHALCVNSSKFGKRSEYQAHLIESLRNLKHLLRDEELEATVEELTDLNRDTIEGLGDLMEMAQSLKDFSRLDRAPVGSFDVNAGIEKTLTIARNIVKHKAEVKKEFGKLPPIECSPSKINQVFLNLITNAAQAIETQGEITIATRTQGDDHVVIAISDTGCGIPDNILHKIRDPFFTTKEVGSGTGLGLSIVDDIIRSHGGQLHIESKVGVGSTFSVVLPIRHVGAASDVEAGAALAEAV